MNFLPLCDGVQHTQLAQFRYAAIERLRRERTHGQGVHGHVAYFYCSRRDNDSGRRDPKAIVRALLKAVLMESGCNPETISLETRYRKRTNEGELNLKEAQSYLVDLLQQADCRQSVILIDALDEVEFEGREVLFRVMSEIVANTTAKVWITSRPEVDIQRAVLSRIAKASNKSGGVIKHVAVAKRNKIEIRRYIEKEIDARIAEDRLEGIVDEMTRTLIIETLDVKGDGM